METTFHMINKKLVEITFHMINKKLRFNTWNVLHEVLIKQQIGFHWILLAFNVIELVIILGLVSPKYMAWGINGTIDHICSEFAWFFHYESHASKGATTHFGREHNTGIILSFLLHLMWSSYTWTPCATSTTDWVSSIQTCSFCYPIEN